MILGVMIVSLTIFLHETHKLTPIFLDFSLSELPMKRLPVLHVCGIWYLCFFWFMKKRFLSCCGILSAFFVILTDFV